ncbi:hypothetical protein [Pseudonocardia endophytica]|uniref:Uncharacterized protein n=1 Tax=Pseudonocardia endophytica TaxID=401976 RepID=A0A4R1HJK6_PSEEN|nr:hypothetical protein [Pseudonocardia endophytica]TCK22507.1 hypothetical protein EV378_6512 [Pseudonocardia endophytica]
MSRVTGPDGIDEFCRRLDRVMTVNSEMATIDRLSPRNGALRAGLGLSELTVDELRRSSTRLGETVGDAELESALTGGRELDDDQYDVVAQAINERLVEIGLTPMIPRADEI